MAVTGSANYVPTNRSTWWGVVRFGSGTATSDPFPFDMGSYALGAVVPSGTIPAAAGTHMGIQQRNWWGDWHFVMADTSGFEDVTMLYPSGNAAITMPPRWFNVVGSARLVLTDGSGVGVTATANFVCGVQVKS